MKTAIITGARTGIGLAILDKFASMGINIWAVVHRCDDSFLQHTEELMQRNKVWVKSVSIDLADSGAIAEGIKSIFREKFKSAGHDACPRIYLLISSTALAKSLTMGITVEKPAVSKASCTTG